MGRVCCTLIRIVVLSQLVCTTLSFGSIPICDVRDVFQRAVQQDLMLPSHFEWMNEPVSYRVFSKTFAEIARSTLVGSGPDGVLPNMIQLGRYAMFHERSWLKAIWVHLPDGFKTQGVSAKLGFLFPHLLQLPKALFGSRNKVPQYSKIIRTICERPEYSFQRHSKVPR